MKWIQDWDGHSIQADEVHTSHNESHNSLSGNPQFNVRLAIPWNDISIAISRLLGKPEKWPKATTLKNVVAIDARVVNDQAAYTTDLDKQVVNYITHGLVDVTYIPRNGVYYLLTWFDLVGGGDANQPVYINDEEKPRTETIPMDYNKFIWGETTDVTPTDKDQKLLPGETPVKFDIGQTLIHTIEGWCGFDPAGGIYTELGLKIGGVHNQMYVSPVTGKAYAANTLMLRNYNISKTFNFRSYREEFDPIPTDSFIDYAGRACPVLELIYEYRTVGWERFFRPNLATNTAGYYYIRYAESPYAKVVPFPSQDHSIFFQGTVIP